MFVAIGHDPATSLFKDQIDMDNNGYILTKPDSTQTSLSGGFVAGDVKDKIHRHGHSSRNGLYGCLEVEKYLE